MRENLTSGSMRGGWKPGMVPGPTRPAERRGTELGGPGATAPVSYSTEVRIAAQDSGAPPPGAGNGARLRPLTTGPRREGT
jgi:hypothetical protein